MTNKQRAQHQAKAGSSNTKLIVIGIVAVVVLAAVIAVISSSGSDSDDAAQGTVGTDGTSSVAQTQPVEVVGEPLPTVKDFTDDPAIGMAAPILNGFTFDGTPISIDPADGPVMVVVLAHWCPHCNAEVPRLLSWEAAGGVPEGLRVIGVSTAAAPGQDHYPPSEWINEMGWEWPVLVDSDQQEAAVAYGVSGYPYFTIVGEDGLVKLRASGEKEIAEIDAMVDQALAS